MRIWSSPTMGNSVILWLWLIIPLAFGIAKDTGLHLPIHHSSVRHASPHDFLQAILDSSQAKHLLAGSNVSLVSVLNTPKIVFDASDSASAIQFPSANPSGLILKPILGAQHAQCPWHHEACVSGEFTLSFHINVQENSASGYTHIITLITRDGRNNPWALKIHSALNGYVSVDWNVLGSTGSSRAKPYLVKLQENEWNLLQLTVKLETGEITSNVNGTKELSSMKFIPLDHLNWWNGEDEGMANFIGLMVGPIFRPIQETKPPGTYQLQAIQLETPDTPHRRIPRWRPNVLSSIPMHPVKKISSLRFPENGFVQFEFRNRLRKNTDRESLTIEFDLPKGVTDGLIWFSENHAAKSYVYIKDSMLHYTYVVMDQTGPAHLTLTEEIFLNSTLAPNILHVLTLVRQRDNLTLTLNQRSHASKSIDGRVPLIPSDGRVYLGGSSQPGFDTDGKVKTTFRGRISKAEVSRAGDADIDLVQASKDPTWRDSVRQSGTVTYEYQKPRSRLVISPTASKPARSTWGKMGDAMAVALSREAVPITFMGTQSSIVRFDTWDFTVYHSFEMEFRTFEPNGILFFVGPDREHTDFVCVELYDGNLYFVYAVGDHYRHIQLNPVGTKLNDGKAHRVYVSRNEQHRFLIKFNDRVVDVDQGTGAHQTEFATYTYIGSVDQPTRLPWHVWSRENFAGCITWIRVNDDKFLDASSRMSQHTDVSRGIRFGVCETPPRQCSRDKCGGGECAERSHPFFEQLNFACDCSGSDKTFREGVMDIRRSETCFRDAPTLEMDGDMVYLIDFERQMNTLTTHTDDISLQFRTYDDNVPLFYSVSPADRSYFRVDLVDGKIRVQTNMNHPDDINRSEQFYLSSPPLNDNNWHTLTIKRRADYIHISVDGLYEQTGKIPLLDQLKTFKLVAQQIYLGSAGPVNYQRPPPPGSDSRFVPPPPRFTGEFRNFYWNEYDFIGTSQLPGKYTTDILTPRAIAPVFPQWPREPTYSITCTPNLHYGRLEKLIDIKEGGDMWLIEFKTEYEGVIFSARDPTALDQVHITLALIRGRLQLIYSIYGRSGVYEVTTDELDDGRWHRVVVGLDRRKKQIILFVDNMSPVRIGNELPLSSIKELNFYFGGLPESEWRSVLTLIRNYAPTSLQSSEAEQGNQPAFTGCLGGFSLRADNFGTDLLRRYDSSLISYPPSELVRGFCRAQKRCSATYCRHGQCEVISGNQLRCICTGTGYEGPRCENPILECPPNYCNQRGICSMINGKPVCDCTGSGYHGERCELNPCMSGQYCYNGGRCVMRGNQAECDCRGTGYYGDRCRDSICPVGYCHNGGVCRIDANDRPVCDCRGTGYTGERCEQRGCTPGFCDNGGQCRVNRYGQPECICTGTGFTGPHCRTPICTSDYCLNRGRCVVEGERPRCECRGTGYTGDRCQITVCTEGICANGGRCAIGANDQPVCDCSGTGFGGPHCRDPLCRPGYCQNGGQCVLSPSGQPTCSCEGTGFTGSHCQTSICSPGYCSNGGRCTVDVNNQPVCDCSGTGYGGAHCRDPLCRPGFCQNGGRCMLSSAGQPTCSCEGTGFTGAHCQTPICSPGYCLNGGQCRVDRNDQPYCNCDGTGHQGSRCESSICTPGYCLNGGHCRVNEAGQPECNCFLTNYDGPHCEIPLCPKSYCGDRGLCVVRQRQPTCDCHPGYHGTRCEMEVCPTNYCINGGVCTPGPDRLPRCNCPINYEGDRCELPKVCPPDYCFHGGRCTMNRGVPQCDCLGTDYTGSRCEIVQSCPPGFCQNGGRCSVQGGTYVCDCAGTGYRGVICNEPIACPPNYCLFGGICSVLPGKRYQCDCSRTARTGIHCESSSNGIYVGYEQDGYLIYPLVPSVRTVEDNVTLGFKTYMQSGTLITFLSPDGQYWALKLRDGRVMVDASGKNVYGFRMRSNDGHYHVLNVERKGDTMIVTQDGEVIRVALPGMVNPVDKSLIYNAIHIATDEQKSDIFRGVIGGVYWNGRYPINELKEGRVTSTGEVTIVLTPEFPIAPPKPQPVCTPGYCLNLGRCYAEDYQLKCDCSNTGWNGVRCERQSRGFMPSSPGNGAYIIYSIVPPKRTNNDEMRVAFQTWSNDGPIARVVQADASYYDIVLVDGKLFATFNGNQIIPISGPNQQFNDGRMHVVTVRRENNHFNFTIDGHDTKHQASSVVGVDGSLITREIVLGADSQFQKTFDGVIGGFYWNGRYLIDERGTIVSDALVMKGPGRNPADRMQEVVVVLMPHLLDRTTTKRPGPPKPLPDAIPEGSLGGGVVMPGLGTGNANLGAPIFVPGKIYGGGGAGIGAGTGLMLKQAGGLLGMGGLVDALLAGLLLALLLLISALIWACWRCKPGCCALCLGKSKGGHSASAWDRLVAACCAAPPQKGPPLLHTVEDGYGGHDTVDVHGSRLIKTAYPATQQLDLSHQMDSTNIQIDQPIIGTDQNIYNLEGLKVDCVLITKNSKYFVTGSSMGPPKVWDAQSGDVFKIMDGAELGCTDLHLACDDSVLVTQVVDDVGASVVDLNAVKVKRLQLWDFASGRQLEMPTDVLCTATCLTRTSEHVIVARTTPTGPSILVWNLPENMAEREIAYHPMNQLVKDSVTYLNISMDDRLVLAGFQNPTDDQACYMVFDLAANYGGATQPHIVQFDAEVNATEIISDDHAVTGTRKGELLVWNLHTGQVTRSIQINATLEGGNPAVLPPHSGTVHCVKLSHDRHYLVTGAQDQLVRVWTMPDERLLHTLEGHADDVLSVDISFDSEIVVSGSWDGSIRVWRLRDGNQICWFTSNIEILQVKISRDKRSLVALGERNRHRKLITLRVVRNRVRTTTTLHGGASRLASSMSPPTPGMSPGLMA